MSIINGVGRVGIRSMATPVTTSIITGGLILNLDAGNTSSYQGTGTLWTDLSGNGNNGTLFNGTSYNSDNTGTILFDGVNDYALTDNTNSIGLYNNIGFTVCFFNYRTANTSYQGYVGGGDNSGFQVYGNSNPNKILVELGKIGGGYSSFGTTLEFPSNQWSFTCVKYDAVASTIDIYQNNNRQTFTSANGVSGINVYNLSVIKKIFIGNPNMASRYFGGKLNNIMLYNRVLSNAEVTTNFDSLKSRYGL
jgi:hypothetical protein